MSQVFTYIDTVFLQIVTQYYDQRFALNHIACIIAYICVLSVIVYLKKLACSFASRVTLNTLDTRFYKLTYQQLKKKIHCFSQQLI